ncbi:MAG: DNA recombination protein RmuC [Steroidobacteraceae bacterium]
MSGASPVVLLLVVAALALLVGGVIGWLAGRLGASRRAEELRGELEAARARVAADAERQREQLQLLERSETQLRLAFDELAGQTLRANSEMFLQLARETLGREQAEAQSNLKEREAALTQLLGTIRNTLEKTEKQVESLERERREDFTSLRTQIASVTAGQAQLERETRNLVTALRRPEVRGRWGELTLRRCVELAGMSAHCDFTEQLQTDTPEGALRPDLVVHMPDARDIVVDVKTPLDAYLEAIEAQTDEQRDQASRRHAAQVEARVRALSSKSYWAQFQTSPDFAVLFLPGDQFLSAALAENPDLLDNAMRQNVIVATPSTLIALLKAVAYGWRQADVARNAVAIRDLGQELHKRLGVFVNHLGKLGKNLSGSVDAYNSAIGSLERSVLPQARRFADLGVGDSSTLAETAPVDKLVREPAAPQSGLPAPPDAAP